MFVYGVYGLCCVCVVFVVHVACFCKQTYLQGFAMAAAAKLGHGHHMVSLRSSGLTPPHAACEHTKVYVST